MNIGIAGITCAINDVGGRMTPVLRERYSAFVTSEEPDVRVTLRVAEHVAGRADWRDKGGPLVEVKAAGNRGDAYRLRRHDNPFEAYLDASTGWATACLRADPYCLDSLLRVLFSVLLARRGGVLLHAAGVLSCGQADVLVGRSGAGKTTISRQGFETVLSDELLAVRRMDGDFVAFGTPFWGEFVAGEVNRGAPVGRVFLLRKASSCGIEPTSHARIARELLGCTFFPGPPELARAVLDVCADLAEARSVGELHFSPDHAVVGFLEGGARVHAA